MTHFVYVWIKQGVMWDEMFYSVQSIRKFFKGEYQIFVYGDNPGIRGVHHIACPRVRASRNPKALDSIAKLQRIAADKLINDNFVYMYDDIILLKSCSEADFTPARAIDYVPKPGLYFGPGAKPSRQWIMLFLRTMTTLQQQGFPTWNYETHLPRWFNKVNILDVINKFKLNVTPLLFASLYYNTFEVAPYETLAQNPVIKAGVYDPHQPEWLEKNLNGKLWLNFDNAGLNDHLRRYIKTLLK